MPHEYLQRAIEEGMSFNAIARENNKALGTVIYWAKKYSLKSTHYDFASRKLALSGNTNCIHCRLPIEENNTYGHKVHVCKQCQSAYVCRKAKENRLYAIRKMGGQCQTCNFSHPAALVLHHLDATIKDPGFKNFRKWSRVRIDNELLNCVLLCQNCHVIHHNGAAFADSVPN